MGNDKTDLILFSLNFPPKKGGIARFCKELASHLINQNKEILILTEEPVDRTLEKELEGRCIRLPGRRAWMEWEAIKKLRSFEGKFIVCGTWYPEGLLCLCFSKKRYIVMAHGLELLPHRNRFKRKLWTFLKEQVLKNADFVLANSQYTASLALKASPDAEIKTLNLGVDTSFYYPRAPEKLIQRLRLQSQFKMLCVSRLVTHKGLDLVIKAFAQCPQKMREKSSLIIAGEGPEEKNLKRLARDLKVDLQVVWLGHVQEVELPVLYSACDVFILFSVLKERSQGVEGFGLVLLEAQACGTPVIASRSGGIPDAVEAGNGAWCLPQGDIEALSELMFHLFSNPNLVQEQGGKARIRVESNCTWEIYTKKFINLYESRMRQDEGS